MDCPRDGVTLEITDHKGIEVDSCPQCEGMWLDHPELDQLEDTRFDEDDSKGTIARGRSLTPFGRATSPALSARAR